MIVFAANTKLLFKRISYAAVFDRSLSGYVKNLILLCSKTKHLVMKFRRFISIFRQDAMFISLTTPSFSEDFGDP